MRVFSKNASELFDQLLHNIFLLDHTAMLPVSVSAIADWMGWGWHRTNNALKELGLK